MNGELARRYFGGLPHVHTVLSNHPGHRESDLSVDELTTRLLESELAGLDGAPLRYVMLNEHPSDPAKPRALGRFSPRGRRLLRQARRHRVHGVEMIYGLEVSMLPDGRTDLSPHTVDHRRVVIASRHALPAAVEHEPAHITDLFRAACLDPEVDVLGHPLRYIEHVALDWPAILRAAARTGTAVEVNLNVFPRSDAPQVVTAAWSRWLTDLAESGAWVTLGTDIHTSGQLDQFIAWWQEMETSGRRGKATEDNQLARMINALDKAGIKPERVVTSNRDLLHRWMSMDKSDRSGIK